MRRYILIIFVFIAGCVCNNKSDNVIDSGIVDSGITETGIDVLGDGDIDDVSGDSGITEAGIDVLGDNDIDDASDVYKEGCDIYAPDLGYVNFSLMDAGGVSLRMVV